MLFDTDSNGHFIVSSGLFQPAGQGLIASFEDGEFDDAWGGRKDTVDGDLVTTTERAVDGTTALRHLADAGYDATRSMPSDGLPHYVGVPSRQRHYVYFEDWSVMNAYWRFCWRNNGNDALGLRYWGENSALYFNEFVDGDIQPIARATSLTMPSNKWLEVTITVNDDQGTYNLQSWEPQVEVYQVDSSFNRTTEVVTIRGDDAAGDPIGISTSNALDPGEGGYRWTFQGTAVIDADYHHLPDA